MKREREKTMMVPLVNLLSVVSHNCPHLLTGNAEIVNLNFNRLEGTIPSGIFVNVPELQVFHLGHNGLTGPLPDEFNEAHPLKLLDQFHVQHNKLTGTLPRSLGFLTHLMYLEMDHNKFHGNVPAEWSYLTNLEILRIHRNKLDGTLPHQLGRLTKLEQFQFEDNLLPRALPEKMRQKLTKLDLDAFAAEEDRGTYLTAAEPKEEGEEF